MLQRQGQLLTQSASWPLNDPEYSYAEGFCFSSVVVRK